MTLSASSRRFSKATSHYCRQGTLYKRIIDGISASCISLDAVTADDLKPVDEFHIGGIEATEHLLSHVDGFAQNWKVLDIGCGLGGTVRHIARSRKPAEVAGVDLTPEFVDCA